MRVAVGGAVYVYDSRACALSPWIYNYDAGLRWFRAVIVATTTAEYAAYDTPDRKSRGDVRVPAGGSASTTRQPGNSSPETRL